MKTCAYCKHATLPDGSPVSFSPNAQSPDGLHPFCKSCVRKYPWVNRAACCECGTERKISLFPQLDTSQPCLRCVPAATRSGDTELAAGVAAVLDAAGLTEGGPMRPVSTILQSIGVADTGRETRAAAAEWFRARYFPEGFARGGPAFKAIKAEGGLYSEAQELLANAGLSAGGELRTVTAILQGLGMAQPARSDVTEASAWLRSSGFQEGAACGRRGFRVLAHTGGTDNAFRQWAEKYGALDALQLSAVDRDHYLRGTEPPVAVRLAMSALTAGLPPYA